MSGTSAQHPTAIVTRFSSALATLALSIFLGNVALVAFDVVMRGVFRVPQSWVADIGQLSYPVALACCFPVALESGHMITVRALAGRIGLRATLALDFGGQLCMALLLSLFAWQMFARAFSDSTAGFETSVIALPVAPTWLIVAVVFCISALIQFRQTWRNWMRS